MNARSSNRWVVAVAGIVMQVAFGAVYAWSVFRIPLAGRVGGHLGLLYLSYGLRSSLAALSLRNRLALPSLSPSRHDRHAEH